MREKPNEGNVEEMNKRKRIKEGRMRLLSGNRGGVGSGGRMERWRRCGGSATKPAVAMETCLCLIDASCRSN